MIIKNCNELVEINRNSNKPYVPDQVSLTGFWSIKDQYQENLIATKLNKKATPRFWQNLYVKDPFESKYQLRINRREEGGIKELKNPNTFIDFSGTIDVYGNLEDYNSTKKRKVLLMFDKMMENMEANKKLCPIVVELLRKVENSILYLFLCHNCISKCLGL